MYRYRFERDVPFEDVETSLLLALWAAESLYGETQVRLETAFAVDRRRRICVIDAGSPVGSDLNRLFAGFIHREFRGDDCRIERFNLEAGLTINAEVAA